MNLNFSRNTWINIQIIIGVICIILANLINHYAIENNKIKTSNLEYDLNKVDRIISERWQQQTNLEQALNSIIIYIELFNKANKSKQIDIEKNIIDLYKNYYHLDKLTINNSNSYKNKEKLFNFMTEQKQKTIDEINDLYYKIDKYQTQIVDLKNNKDNLTNWFVLLNLLGLLIILYRSPGPI